MEVLRASLSQTLAICIVHGDNEIAARKYASFRVDVATASNSESRARMKV